MAGLIPLISQLIVLGIKVADAIERSNEISLEDKVAMRAAIREAQTSVTTLTEQDITPGGN